MDISPCVTDEDYEEWRQVRIAVIPYERTQSVAELRDGDSPDRLLLLAREGGTVVGHGLAQRAESASSGGVIPRVLPEHRRQGVGSALLRRLSDHVAAMGLPMLRASVDDEPSLLFAQRFGFTEVNREVEQTYVVTAAPDVSPLPEGVEVVTAQERPALWEECFERFGREALAGFAVDTPLDVSLERWTRELARRPDVPRPPRRRGRRLRRPRPRLRQPQRARRTPSPPSAGTGAATGSRSTSSSGPSRGPPRTGSPRSTRGPRTATRRCAPSTRRLGYATTRTGIQVARALPLD